MNKKLLLFMAAVIVGVIALAVIIHGSAVSYADVAADVLSDFDFEEQEVDYANVCVYYEAADGFVVGISISTYDGVDFQKWTSDDWAQWIKGRAHCVGNREDARVRSASVFFSCSNESYKLEMTDVLYGGGFNRLIRYQPNLADTRLSRKQAEQISGTASAVQLAKQIPEESYSAISSDLSECVNRRTFTTNGHHLRP
ncbi:MAG: hypothetical protein K6F57_02370 [Candidatus Saccharibacteria bacterium]|nr:hypothetical protein [Candidatus Saccharibacteria bacterium]